MNRSRTHQLFGLVVACFAACFSLAAQAAPVSYAAQLETSRHNPVTDILILEADAEGTVHGTVYGQDITGNGYAVINHDPAYEPVRSLIIGLTDGEDEFGDPKVQLVMFVADDFAAANQSVNYSVAFPGAKHSLTIASLEAAIAGDAQEMTWFTDTFFTGPAAAAVFDTHGSFTVAEFTALDTIGGAITVGPWTLNSAFVFIPANNPGSQGPYPTGVLDEAATDPGPFDIEFSVDDNGAFAVDKSVENDTDLAMVGFSLEVGTGTGVNFVPSANANVLQFTNEGSTLETTGAFPSMDWSPLEISFDGSLLPGETANFVFFVLTSTNAEHEVTVRQRAIYATEEEDSRTTFEVTKEFTDGVNPTEVEVTINCFTGLPISQSQTISETETVEFVVTDFDTGELDCEITEEELLGYTPTYTPDGPGTFDAEGGCNFEDVEAGAANTCHIVNDADFVDVGIEKVWVIDGPGGDRVDTEYRLTLHCNAPIEDADQYCPSGGPDNPNGTPPSNQYCKKFYGNDSQVFIAQVQPQYPGSSCWVDEQVYDDSVEINNDCDNIVISAGTGDGCQITNTVFFEGIPTLNQYGVAILALLMLGVGFVTYRRIV